MCVDNYLFVSKGLLEMISKRLMSVMLCAFLLGGCASFEAPSYSPDYKTIDNLKSKSLQSLSLGEFMPMSLQAKVNKISLRAAGLKAKQGTFTQYFKDALQADLIELGIYSEDSSLIINATLLENDIDISGFSNGYGVIKVSLEVKKYDAVVFNKTYEAHTEFESSFAAAVAVPKAQSEYPVLVKTLLTKIYMDYEFYKAVSK